MSSNPISGSFLIGITKKKNKLINKVSIKYSKL